MVYVVQPCNDITTIMEKYGDRFAIIGGFDSNGPVATEDSPEEDINAEIDRCFRDYAPYRKSYIYWGFMVVNSVDPERVLRSKKLPLMHAAELSYQQLSASMAA